MTNYYTFRIPKLRLVKYLYFNLDDSSKAPYKIVRVLILGTTILGTFNKEVGDKRILNSKF
jgi:hypothetical protein